MNDTRPATSHHARGASPRPSARRGNTYLLVLGITSLLTVTTLMGVTLLRANRAQLAQADEMVRARTIAASAIDLGLEMVARDDAWRSSLGEGGWIDKRRVSDDAVLSLAALDAADDDFNDDMTDDVIFVATGQVNSTVQTIEAVMAPRIGSFSSMGAAVYAGGDLSIETSSLEAEPFLAAAGAVSEHGDPVDDFEKRRIDDDEAVYLGPLDLDLPNSADALNELRAIATEIPVDDIPGAQISNTMLSAKSNPFGEPNPRGVYLIDCNNRRFVVRDSVIRGTIILLRPGAGSEVTGKMYWEPAQRSDPILVISGDHTFSMSADPVVTAAIARDDLHADDVEWLNSHDSLEGLRGFIYVDGDLLIKNELDLAGTIVASGSVTLEGDLIIQENIDYASSDVVGFRQVKALKFRTGQWRRVVR